MKKRQSQTDTIASYAMKKFGIEYQGFLLLFVRTKINLIAFSDPSNCVNTQYASLSGAMGKCNAPLSGNNAKQFLPILQW